MSFQKKKKKKRSFDKFYIIQAFSLTDLYVKVLIRYLGIIASTKYHQFIIEILEPVVEC